MVSARRVHASSRDAADALNSPRLAPALLLAARAHCSLAEGGGGEGDDDGDQHRQRACDLLHSLRSPPHEPARARVYRVRASEKREIDALLLSMEGGGLAADRRTATLCV